MVVQTLLNPLLLFVLQLGRGDIKNTPQSIRAFCGRLLRSPIISGSVVWHFVCVTNINFALGLQRNMHAKNILYGFRIMYPLVSWQSFYGLVIQHLQCQMNIRIQSLSLQATGRITEVQNKIKDSSNGRGGSRHMCFVETRFVCAEYDMFVYDFSFLFLAYFFFHHTYV